MFLESLAQTSSVLSRQCCRQASSGQSFRLGEPINAAILKQTFQPTHETLSSGYLPPISPICPRQHYTRHLKASGSGNDHCRFGAQRGLETKKKLCLSLVSVLGHIDSLRNCWENSQTHLSIWCAWKALGGCLRSSPWNKGFSVISSPKMHPIAQMSIAGV